MENWKGPGKPKVAYIFGDNPAGREPLAVMEDIAALEGVELRTYAVPPPYIEMRPQVIDITRRFKADWIVSHLFGRAPGISLKEFHRMGTPLTRVVGLVWSAAESDIRVAGWDTAEGYYNVQFAFVGSTGHPLLDDVRALYKSEGKPPPEAMSTSVYYNRGLAAAALHAEAIRTAIAAKGINITSVDVKNAMERIKDFSLDDFMAPINMAPDNHEGGGFVRIFQVHDGGYRPITGWYQGYRDVVLKRLATEG
jgi:branched-chain amino acid transport system substrate-binding protein